MTARPFTRLLSAAAVCASLMAPAAQAADIQIPTQTKDEKLAAMLPDAVKKAGVLKLATDAHYPPCESFAEDGKTMVGFEPDLWNAIGQLFGIPVDAVSIEFAGLIPGVEAGRYDVAMECISDSAEREKKVTFVNYAYGMMAIYTMADNDAITDDPLSLCGKSTAVQLGTDFATTVQDYLSKRCEKAGKPPIKMGEMSSAAATLLALYAGRIDFALNNAASLGDLQAKAPKPIKAVSNELMPKKYLGIVTKQDNAELQKALEAALVTLVANGTYDKVMDKWSLDLMKLKEPGINLGTTKPIAPPQP